MTFRRFLELVVCGLERIRGRLFVRRHGGRHRLLMDVASTINGTMRVERLSNPREYRARVESLLLQDEARHNLMLGLSTTLVEHPGVTGSSTSGSYRMAAPSSARP